MSGYFFTSEPKKTHPKGWGTRFKGIFSCAVKAMIITAMLPTLSTAELASFFDEPDTVFASNVVIDIIEHNGGVWFATGEGVNFSFDSGRTWLLYNASNGLVSNNLSALYSINDRIWVATNHESDFDFTLSDGLTYSDDNGNTWTQINFGPEGLNIPHVWGGDRTIFDITGYNDVGRGIDWLFFTAFAGGILASQDGGLSWRRIFPSYQDSLNFDSVLNVGIEPSLRNRYFSCATDTSHGDTLYVWAGTAGGLFQYVYASPRDKPFSKRINRIAFCDQCSDSGGSFVYIGGENGITRGVTSGAPFISRFEPDGLPGPYISALLDFQGKLLVGTMDAGGANSTGMAVSTDQGDTYTALSLFTEVTGSNRRISDFAVIRERLYMAAEEAGLFVSLDTGETWSHIYVDSSDTTSDNRRNAVHALNALVDTLRIGTDSGLVTLYLDTNGLIDSSHFDVFLENDTSSAKVIRVKTQLFYDSTGVTYDSLSIWTVNRPLTPSGTPVVFRSHDTLFSPEETDTLWVSMQWGVNTNDINFFGDTAYVVGEAGIRFTKRGDNPSFIVQVLDSTSTDRLDNDNITVMEVRGDTVFFGSDNGFAISNNRGKDDRYKIYRVNTDSLGADFVVNYAINVPGITGEFMPALRVQYIEDESARIWVSNRPAFSGGSEGISIGLVLPDTVDQVVTYDRVWKSVYHDGFAWNFAFNGDSVFAATDGGLLFNDKDTGLTWDTIPLVDSSGVPLVLPGTPVYGIEVIDKSLWVGTGDRTLRLNLDSLTVDLSLYVVDSSTPPDQVYAFPVPFSHSQDLGVDFHFAVEQEARVTLEVYDFAMNLVKRVIDGQSFAPGVYPAVGTLRGTWDGRNDRREQVAVGVYYFKVEYSTGEVRWGKLAVIP